MIEFNSEYVWANARKATTEDLLDRVTVYRNGMEPEALDIVEAELRRRGVREDAIDAHARERGEIILMPDGSARPCSYCRGPAVVQEWGWHRLWGKLPIFPRILSLCAEHRPHDSDEG